MVFGIDSGKKVFRLVALDATGTIIQRAELSRDTLMAVFNTGTKALIGMETCCGCRP